MATRSFLIIANPKGDFTGTYCHSDGYPSGVGATLLKHYSTEAKARALSCLGDLSALYAAVAPSVDTHSFDTPEAGVTIAYGRDRGEPWAHIKFTTHGTLTEAVADADARGCEYIYLFWNGHWSYLDTEAALVFGTPWANLTEENTSHD
jgi:hypothetical protein